MVTANAGAVDGVSAAFGLHVWPTLPSGTVGSRPGTITAATNKFTVDLHGRGGHGAMPHLNVDPWPAVAHYIMALQVWNGSVLVYMTSSHLG